MLAMKATMIVSRMRRMASIVATERWRPAGWSGGVLAAGVIRRMLGVLPGRRRDAADPAGADASAPLVLLLHRDPPLPNRPLLLGGGAFDGERAVLRIDGGVELGLPFGEIGWAFNEDQPFE